MQKDEILKSIHEMFPHAEAIHIFSSGKAPSDTATDMAPNCTFGPPLSSPLCLQKLHANTHPHIVSSETSEQMIMGTEGVRYDVRYMNFPSQRAFKQSIWKLRQCIDGRLHVIQAEAMRRVALSDEAQATGRAERKKYAIL